MGDRLTPGTFYGSLRHSLRRVAVSPVRVRPWCPGPGAVGCSRAVLVAGSAGMLGGRPVRGPWGYLVYRALSGFGPAREGPPALPRLPAPCARARLPRRPRVRAPSAAVLGLPLIAAQGLPAKRALTASHFQPPAAKPPSARCRHHPTRPTLPALREPAVAARRRPTPPPLPAADCTPISHTLRPRRQLLVPTRQRHTERHSERHSERHTQSP